MIKKSLLSIGGGTETEGSRKGEQREDIRSPQAELCPKFCVDGEQLGRKREIVHFDEGGRRDFKLEERRGKGLDMRPREPRGGGGKKEKTWSTKVRGRG